MKNIRLIILDFDGTLGDTRRNILLTMRQTMEELSLPMADDEACAATIGLPLRDCFVQLYPDISDELADLCAATYRRIFDINKKRLVPALFPHVRTTLQQLHALGYVLTVASSRSSASLREFLTEMEVIDCISFILGADDVRHAKPDPEPVLLTLSACGVPAAEALVVGDMPVDILMGARAGAKTCAVTYGNASADDLRAAGADVLIDDFAQLLSLLEKGS